MVCRFISIQDFELLISNNIVNITNSQSTLITNFRNNQNGRNICVYRRDTPKKIIIFLQTNMDTIKLFLKKTV